MTAMPPGSVSGVEAVGGLVGHNDGSVRNTYALGDVSGTLDVGGLVGNNNGGDVTTSYANG